MNIDNFKGLLFCILTVLLLLGVCMSLDYADDVTIDNTDCRVKDINTTKVKVVNNVSVVEVKDNSSYFVAKNTDKIHTIKVKTEKAKVPVIGMYAKPSCGCGYSYRWHYRRFVNYCPNCHHYNTLRKNPKGVPEREFTCCRCSSDFCGVCGKEKYSWSRTYLRSA